MQSSKFMNSPLRSASSVYIVNPLVSLQSIRKGTHVGTLVIRDKSPQMDMICVLVADPPQEFCNPIHTSRCSSVFKKSRHVVGWSVLYDVGASRLSKICKWICITLSGNAHCTLSECRFNVLTSTMCGINFHEASRSKLITVHPIVILVSTIHMIVNFHKNCIEDIPGELVSLLTKMTKNRPICIGFTYACFSSFKSKMVVMRKNQRTNNGRFYE